MPAVPASIPTRLKLPGALKLQLEKDAKQMGMSLGKHLHKIRPMRWPS
jgi:hypothetical protein